MILRSWLFTIVIGSTIVLGGCDSSSSPTGPASHPLAGIWSGTISESTNNLHCFIEPTETPVDITAELVVESDSSLRATLTRVDGSSCEAVGTLDATSFSLRFDPCADLFTGEVACQFDGWIGWQKGPVTSIDWDGRLTDGRLEGVGWARSTGAGGGAAGLKIQLHR